MSIWDKLGRGPVRAVSVPGVRVPRAPSMPSVTIGAEQLRVTVVEALDPDELAPDPAPPDAEVLARLCDEATGALHPGYLAFLPADPELSLEDIEVVNGTLTIAGLPVTDRPFALISIEPADDASPLPATLALEDLDDLEQLRRQLHRDLAARDPRRSAASFRAAIDRIVERPGLADDDRWRLARGLEREYLLGRRAGLGAAPPPVAGWKAFIAGVRTAGVGDRGPIDAAALLTSLTPRIDGGAESAPAPPVHWNTRILDDVGAPIDDELVVARTYRIINKLDPARAADAYFPFTEVKGAIAGGAPVTFIVEGEEPVLRAEGADGWSQRVEITHPYDSDTGETPAATVELRAEGAPRKLSLALSLLVDGTSRASALTRLRVVAPAPAPAAAAPAPAPAPVSASASASLAAPAAAARQRVLTAAALHGKAALLLDLTAANQLQLRAGAVVGPPCTPHRPAREIVNTALLARNELVDLAQRYAPDDASPPFGLADGPAAVTAMATIGARLHAAFFGLPGQRLDANLRELAVRIAKDGDARLQIAAAFQPFPWNVFYDGAWRNPPVPPERAADDPSGFWGRRFRIDRAIVGHMPEVPRLELPGPLRVQPFINPHLDGRARNHTVAVVEPQRALFTGFPAADVVAAAPIERDAELVAYLQAQPGPCDLFYFMGHAESAASLDEQFGYAHTPADDQARLVLDRAGGTTVARMAELRQAPLEDRPLVFLNACSTVAGDQAFAPPLLAQFLDQWGAAGVLGTDWQVPAVFADAFARRLLAYFVGERRPLAAALAAARDDAFAQDNPFALVYALYAPPDLVRSPAAP